MAELNLRTSALHSITRIYERVTAEIWVPVDDVEIGTELRMLQQHFDRFVSNHLLLVQAATDNDEIATHETLYQSTEEMYMTVTNKLERSRTPKVDSDIESVRSQVMDLQVTGPKRTNDMRLDPLQIPVFDGEHENWLVFKDMFETLVHNREDIEPAFKLGKLRQCVRADKVPMIHGFYTGGYEQVWEDLKRRYDNDRQLVQTHVTRLLDLKDNPIETTKLLRDIVDCVRNTLRALAVMKLPVEQWDGFLVPFLLRKLPSATCDDWGMTLKSPDIPTLDDLLSFIELRSMNVSARKPSSTHTSDLRRQDSTRRSAIRSHAAQTTQQQSTQSSTPSRPMSVMVCPRCSGPHRITKCVEFKNLNVQQRRDMASALSLCYNCLAYGHGVNECTSTTCQLCKRKHNTLLCKSGFTTTTAAAIIGSSSMTQVSTPQLITSTPGTLPPAMQTTPTFSSQPRTFPSQQ